jgi:hypothetical protein
VQREVADLGQDRDLHDRDLRLPLTRSESPLRLGIVESEGSRSRVRVKDRAHPAEESNMTRSPERRRPARWPWLSVMPLGVGAWAPIYAGVRAGERLWIAWGALWSAVVIAGWAWPSPGEHGSNVKGALLVIGWLGAMATSFALRDLYEAPSPFADMPAPDAVRAAQRRVDRRRRDRRRARRLARTDPALAVEMGIGRPDRADAAHGWVVDVNSAPAGVLMTLPHIDRAIADAIVAERDAGGGYRSVDELGFELDLPARAVERLRLRTVFLPRE